MSLYQKVTSKHVYECCIVFQNKYQTVVGEIEFFVIAASVISVRMVSGLNCGKITSSVTVF